MKTDVEFCFDFGSPTAYLAYCRLQQLQAHYSFDLTYTPILLGGVFKATDNVSPVAIPAKGKYMLEQDLPRFAKRYGVELTFNPFFPINTLPLMRGAIAAQRLGCFDAYAACVYRAVWIDAGNMGDPEIIKATLEKAGLDAGRIINMTQDPDVKAALINNTDQAVKRGAFGAPTLFTGDQMFFGQDRLDFVEEALAAASHASAS
ncbi:MAG: 2-hydroxychromene-2-carboxylate isomerase [Pseudomonadota bacterium]